MPSIYINTWYKEIYWYLLKISCSCSVQWKIFGDHFHAYNVSCFQDTLWAATRQGEWPGCRVGEQREHRQSDGSGRICQAVLVRIGRVFLGSHLGITSWGFGCTKVKPSRRELSKCISLSSDFTLPPWKLGVYVMCSRHSLQLGSLRLWLQCCPEPRLVGRQYHLLGKVVSCVSKQTHTHCDNDVP